MKKSLILGLLLFCYSFSSGENNRSVLMSNSQNQSKKKFVQMNDNNSPGGHYLSPTLNQQENLHKYSHNGRLTSEPEKPLIAGIIKDDFQVSDGFGGISGRSIVTSVVMDSNGSFIIVCQNFHNGYGIYYQRFHPSGAAAGCYTKVNEAGWYALFPDIAMDDDGNFVIVWQDDRNGSNEIYFQRYDASGFPLGENVRVSVDTELAVELHLSVVMNKSGSFIIAYADGIKSDVFYQRFDASGFPQGDNVKVNTGSEWTWRPSVAMDDSGNFVIAWATDLGGWGNIYYQRYNSSGIARGGNVKMNNAVQPSSPPAVAIGQGGNFIIVWEDYRNGNADIYYQRYDAAGVAKGGSVKANDDIGSAKQRWPDIAMNKTGGFIISWADRRDLPDTSHYDIYYQRYDAAGTALGNNIMVNNAPQQFTYGMMSSTVAVDDNGNHVIVWVDSRHGYRREYIYYQSYDSSGIAQGTNRYIRDGREMAVVQKAPAVAGDVKGNLIFVWEQYYIWGDIYYKRYDSTGVAQSGKVTPDENIGIFTSQKSPAVATNKRGCFVIAWEDYRNGNFDIYFQRYDCSGVTQGGNVKANDDPANASQNHPAVAMNKNGDFILVWEDHRNYDPDIYYQRYDSTGIARGGNVKVKDDMANGLQEYPSVIMDERGNFVIVWQHKRDSNFNIYYQMYNSYGEALGSNQKVNDDAGPADQIYPSIAVDENGNFIIAWEDWRNGNPDIYFQWYQSSGVARGGNVKSNDDIGTTIQRYPAAAMSGEGNFVIAWEDYRFGWENPDVLGQRYQPDGTPWGDNYRIVINGPNFGEKAPAVTATSEMIIFSWIDNRDSTDGRWNVFGKIATWDWEGVVSVNEKLVENIWKPQDFKFSQNYPNPFNPTTVLEYSLPKTSHVQLIIYNLLGRQVKTLVDVEQSAGHFQVTWDGTDEHNLPVAAGLYLCRMEAGEVVKVIKLALVK
ncbi:MAG: T9SS type A sorting domain-containing protein [bacterium]|nr:MAG: T9SS type A sorting domain-containing protein [bacterium]